MRESGYYWVRKGEDKPGNWHPLSYDSALCCWWYKGATILNSFWDEIDETPIERKSSDLNALIQSEEKERRELLDRYTKYLLTQNTISLNPKTVDYDEMRKLVINRFLESEKGGEG